MSAISNPAPSTVPQPEKMTPVAVPPPPRKSPRNFLIGVCILAAAAWAGYEFGYKPLKAREAAQATVAAVPTIKVGKAVVESRLRVNGSTAAREFANVTAPMIRGPESNRPMVLLKLAPSGAIVKKGDLLAAIDGQSLQDHIDEVKDTVQTAEGDVRKRKAELEIDWKNLMQTVEFAKADLEKARLEAGAAEVRTEVERQLLQLNFEEAEARYKQVQSDIENTRKRQAADLKILEFTLARHRRHLDRHDSDLKRFEIYSPMDGLVVYQSTWGGSTMRQIEVGDQVAPGQPFMKVVNASSMMLDARINQSESEHFKIGQQASMRLDAFPGLELKGHVFSIGAIATGGWRQNFYIRNVPIKIAFDTIDRRLIPDLSGSADVLLDASDEAVSVPLGAIVSEGGKSYVNVKSAKGFEKREIKTGLRNETHAAVVSGLNPGDEIRLR
jgi:HlyD family secretion protein